MCSARSATFNSTIGRRVITFDSGISSIVLRAGSLREKLLGTSHSHDPTFAQFRILSVPAGAVDVGRPTGVILLKISLSTRYVEITTSISRDSVIFTHVTG